ncbi:type IV pilus assembly protein PilM [Zhaonella formicivorans]|jgi:type IV pilus assembly protein PilM|uniref:type IV pilus assembly protein PilM n=1 Tax=Zhaonella formicivorans TaxID=2528593 RepID=UPI0010E703A4|nr:type IV pilus assembly protein PilM [Zhaonella formicivorans]
MRAWKKFFNKIRPTIGIDIGSTSIKTVELHGNSRNLQLVSSHRRITPPDAIVDGVISNPGAVVKELNEIVEHQGWQGRQVVTAIGGRKVVIRHLKLPVMPDSELKQAVHWEAEKYLPFGKQELVLDFASLGQVGGESGKQLLILLAIVPKEVAMGYYEVCSAAGLDLVAIDIIPLALQRALFFAETNAQEIAVADIGAELTTFSVISAGKVSFARTIAAAGRSINKAIANSFNLEVAAAQELKEKASDVFEIKSPEMKATEFPGLEVIIRDSLLELAQELRRSIDFWRTQSNGKNIAKLILTGGTARLTGIDRLLSQELELPVEIGHPLKHLLDSGKVLEPDFAVASGLAMRGVGD